MAKKVKKTLKELQYEQDFQMIEVIGNKTDSGLVKGHKYRVRVKKARELVKAGFAKYIK